MENNAEHVSLHTYRVLEGSLIGMIPESKNERSSHAVETFFPTGDPMNYNIPIIPGKNTQNLVATLSQKRDHRGYSVDHSHRNISFFFYENFCTDRYCLTRKFDIAHTGIPDNNHLGG